MQIENVKTVQELYGAFARGDVAAIAGRVTEDTRWDFNGGRPELVPWHRPVESKRDLPAFFQALGAGVELSAFEPREFIHCGPHVIVPVRIAYTVRKTGRKVDMEQLHWWSFDSNGKVERLRHFDDTAQLFAACA